MPPELSLFKHIEYYSVSVVASSGVSEAEPMDHEQCQGPESKRPPLHCITIRQGDESKKENHPSFS